MLVATHNLMHGVRLDDLVGRYRMLRDAVGLDILCVQESCAVDGRAHTERIAEALGACYREVSTPSRTGVGVVFDGSRLELIDARLLSLPKLESLTWLERRYIAGGKPERKLALLALFRDAGGTAPLAVVAFHLETAGNNHHRRAQVAAIAAELRSSGHAGRAIVCGDTNAFDWRRRRQPEAVRGLLAPLATLGLTDVAGHGRAAHRATHFFARQREPRLTHRLTVLAGKLGLDLPLRYDVICTSLPTTDHGVVETPESDHDLVWAALNAS